ncbi:MAG TPA: molybdopterin cofactor-binding domain-containing protein [Chloroflexota bacterium]|nr:molybdopterin cofactor-binding domain-containing protein [Chloroflexota bacterium]
MTLTEEAFDVIGTSIAKPDGLSKTTGNARFADDLKLPRMAFCRLLRGTRPHARIRSIDTSAARALPGVFGVITGRDMPVKYGVLPVGQDEEALCTDKIRYVGDAVAAVAAVDEETAERALDLIHVDYAELPTYLSIDEGLTKAGEPIHAGKFGNAHRAAALEFGDVDAALAAADHVFEDTYFFQGNTHLPLEQHACVVEWSPAERLTMWTSTQSPHYVHKELATALGLREEQVRVIAPPVGGGFGGKLELFQHEAAAAKLAMLTGRPIKAALNREEVFYCHRGRHPVLMWLKTGWTKTGCLTGMDFKSYVDGGAYTSYGAASLYYTGALQAVCEHLPAYRWQGLRVLTNKPPCGPKRGHGTPQPRFALECHFDTVAERLGIPVLDLRRQNFLGPNRQTVNHLRITSNGLQQCADIVARESQFAARHGKLPFGKGLGFAVGAYLCGAGLPLYWNDMPHSSVTIRLDRSGVVTVACGQIDIGQGSNSMLVSVVSEALGARPEQVALVSADTDLTPIDLGSYSSRVTFMAGNAAIDAATRLRNLLLGAASAELDLPVDELVLRRGVLSRRDGIGPTLSFAELVKLAESREGALAATGSYKPPKLGGPFKGSGVGPSPAYSYSAAVVEVDVDPETGWVTVDSVWLAHDIGRALNPVLVEGQIEGSIYMALGEALMEEQVFRGERGPRVLGVHTIPSMLEYKSPTTFETPAIHTYLVETLDPEGPFGAKEVGQGPLLPVIPAIANAVFDAVGVRIDETPITPDKVLRALEARAEGKPARVGPTKIPTYPFPRLIKVAPPWEERHDEPPPALREPVSRGNEATLL